MTTPISIAIGRSLRAARRNRRMSIVQVSDWSGIPPWSIRRAEQGRPEGLERLDKHRKAVGLPWGTILVIVAAMER